MEIITNNRPRDLKTFYDMPTAAQSDFDYVYDDDERMENRFFCYRGSWYDAHEFQITPAGSDLLMWSGYQPDSYFSGIVIRYKNDWDQVVVGRYCN